MNRIVPFQSLTVQCLQQKHRSFHSILVLTHYRIVKVVLYVPLRLTSTPPYNELVTALVKLLYLVNRLLTGKYFRLTGQQVNRNAHPQSEMWIDLQQTGKKGETSDEFRKQVLSTGFIKTQRDVYKTTFNKLANKLTLDTGSIRKRLYCRSRLSHPNLFYPHIVHS